MMTPLFLVTKFNFVSTLSRIVREYIWKAIKILSNIIYKFRMKYVIQGEWEGLLEIITNRLSSQQIHNGTLLEIVSFLL